MSAYNLLPPISCETALGYKKAIQQTTFFLLQLDAGVSENIALHSRDEQSVLVVSYSDLKGCLQTTFSDVCSASGSDTTSR